MVIQRALWMPDFAALKENWSFAQGQAEPPNLEHHHLAVLTFR